VTKQGEAEKKTVIKRRRRVLQSTRISNVAQEIGPGRIEYKDGEMEMGVKRVQFEDGRG
jgi:hypothetical protein